MLAERLDQRNAVDFELAHILNRPPVSASTVRRNSGSMPESSMPPEYSRQVPSQGYQQQSSGRDVQTYRNKKRSESNETGLQIGREVDKNAEQAAKKRYQQELQAQMREVQMRKAQEKQARDEYDRKLEAEIQRYNYFGRSGGGAPMRDKDGNVVANLADVRNPPPPSQQQYITSDDNVYSLGNEFNSVGNPSFYNGEQQQYPSNSVSQMVINAFNPMIFI